MGAWCLFVCLLFVVVPGGEGKRPELVGSSVWFRPNATILNSKWDSMLVQMDFDQPLYTNSHPFLCPFSETACPKLNCKACDWSGQEPTGCDDAGCCGPAEHGDMDLAREWCSTEGPKYTTLKIGEISERFTLSQGEKMYVRFFVPEEYYCRPINIIPRAYYGSPSAAFSTMEAVPTFSTEYGWRESLQTPTFGFGQNVILICPNRTLHPQYTVGTFAGMFYGMVPTSFDIEILVSPQAHPLPEPKNRLSCDDMPDDVMSYASANDQAFCVEDGKTLTLDPTLFPTDAASVAFSIPKGCHTLSFVTASDAPAPSEVAQHLFCLPSQTNEPRMVGNSAYFRISSAGEGMVLAACFEEEVTYMFCSIRFFRPNLLHFQFSTVASVVRKSLMELPESSLAIQDGLQHAWAVSFGKQKYGCVDFFTACFDWLVTPSDESLFYYPPPIGPTASAERTIIFEDIQEVYREAGLETKKENRVSLTVMFSSETFQALEKNLTTLSIAISALTNKDGEIVNLPGGGVDENPDDQKIYSISNFVSHIPVSQLSEFQYPSCDSEKYAKYQELVQKRLEDVANQSGDLLSVLSLKYSLDAMNQGVLAQSCTLEVADNLDTYETAVVLRESTPCLPEFGTIQYWTDPCCNPFLSYIACCIPSDYNATLIYYGDDADVSDCGEPECAQSYYQELSFSLNHFEDVDLGCTSGVKDPISSFALQSAEAMDKQYISCLESVGFGENYQGIYCEIDADCDNLMGECYLGTCTLPPLEIVEAQFLSCYIASMPSSLESYLRRNILPENVSNAEKNSTEFYSALKEAATSLDCVSPSNPLQIDFRTQYRSEPVDFSCLARVYGLTWPKDAEEVMKLCPGTPFLRSFPVSINVSGCEETCFESQLVYVEATEETCPTAQECSINDLGDDCDGSYCVYCPPNGSGCVEVPNLTNEEECTNAVACEFPDGTVEFNFTEEECRNQRAGCSTDCPGESCESIHSDKGGCFALNISSSSYCSTYGRLNNETVEWYKDKLCVLTEIDSQSSCEEFSLTEWETCQQNAVDECKGGTTPQQYLGCYISLWHECPNKEECEASGRCSDRDYYTVIHSKDPVNVQYGICLVTGEYVGDERPSCGSLNLFDTIITGCTAFTVNNSVDCVNPAIFNFAQWVEPSLTKNECLAKEIGKSGCRVMKLSLDVLFWILEDDDCFCRGGAVENAWEWLPGVWRGGVPRSLEWKNAKNRENNQFKEALSFILLANWIQASSEEQFLFPIQSQIICESESINTPVVTLVCDCLADGGEICYDEQADKEISMGLSEVCEGEITFVKDPSAQVNFGTDSVSDGCSFLNISLLSRNWFSAPFAPPPLSFKWENPRDQGVVVNQNDATVGEVLGDGLVLSFSDPSIVEEFDICLRLNAQKSAKYDVEDFGYATLSLDVIYPLGLKVSPREFTGGDWYCSSFDYQSSEATNGDTIYLFPINRVEDYEEELDEYTDDTTKALCYTLGVLYCVVGFLNCIGLMAFLKKSFKEGQHRISLPNFCTFTFLILCVFRACFMFLYPTGTFEYEPLAYFIVFETPTFLLFSTVIFVIYIFKRLVFKNSFFTQNPVHILLIGWSFVWLLWAVIVIIYSEVILGNTSSTACEGRIEASYDDEEEQTRTLAIAYQSVIITITLFLTIIFFYYTYTIYTTTENKTNAFTQFVVVVGGSFNVAFALRSILFIFMLAIDFASAVYLFCILFLTEILMMVFLFVQFHQHFLQGIKSSFAKASASSKTSKISSNNS